MLIKRLYLKNIRSYAEADFRFSPNITLIQGPVGVGKSSLFMAIHFALFGTSLERGVLNRLLKRGANSGVIVMEIEHQAHTYTISRSIERKKTTKITQSDAYIIQNNKKIRLSPSELNARILTLLNIENASKFSSLFYVAQDQLKQILYTNEEERINRIRAIFNIKKYHQCKENEKVIKRNIEQEIALLKKDVEGLSDVKDRVNNLEQELKNLKVVGEEQDKNLDKLKQLFSKNDNKQKEIQKEIENIEKNKQQRANIQKNLSFLKKSKQDIEKNIKILNEKIMQAENTLKEKGARVLKEDTILMLNAIVKQKNKTSQQIVQFQTILEEIKKQKSRLLKEIEQYKKTKDKTENKIADSQNNIKEIERKYFEIFRIKPDLEKIKKIQILKEDLQKEIERLQSESEKLREEKQKLNAQLENLEKQKSQLLNAGAVCPVCKSPLADDKKTQILKDISEKSKGVVREIEMLLSKIKEKETEIKKKNKLAGALEEINSDLFVAKYKEKEELIKSLEEIENKIKNAEKENQENDEKQRWLQMQIRQKQQRLAELTKKEEEISKTIEEHKNATMLAEKIKILKEQKEKENQRIKEINDEINKTQEKLQEIASILQSASPSIVEDLEKIQKEKAKIQKAIEEAQYKTGKIEQKKADIEKEIEKAKKNQIQLETQKKLKEQKELLLFWLDKLFIKMLTTIEIKVTQEILKNFEILFKTYFKKILPQTDFDIKINELFTPVFYSKESIFYFEDLSGGEKTAAALSYHLALVVLLEKYSKTGLKGILLLDEPTTGLGAEQIQRMQDLLGSLPLKQTLIVSHESTLEKSAHHLIKICKTDGQSYAVC